MSFEPFREVLGTRACARRNLCPALLADDIGIICYMRTLGQFILLYDYVDGKPLMVVYVGPCGIGPYVWATEETLTRFILQCTWATAEFQANSLGSTGGDPVVITALNNAGASLKGMLATSPLSPSPSCLLDLPVSLFFVIDNSECPPLYQVRQRILSRVRCLLVYSEAIRWNDKIPPTPNEGSHPSTPDIVIDTGFDQRCLAGLKTLHNISFSEAGKERVALEYFGKIPLLIRDFITYQREEHEDTWDSWDDTFAEYRRKLASNPASMVAATVGPGHGDFINMILTGIRHDFHAAKNIGTERNWVQALVDGLRSTPPAFLVDRSLRPAMAGCRLVNGVYEPAATLVLDVYKAELKKLVPCMYFDCVRPNSVSFKDVFDKTLNSGCRGELFEEEVLTDIIKNTKKYIAEIVPDLDKVLINPTVRYFESNSGIDSVWVDDMVTIYIPTDSAYDHVDAVVRIDLKKQGRPIVIIGIQITMAYLEKHANTVNFFLKSDRPSTMKSSNVCWFESARQITESEYHLLWVVPDFLAATEEVKFFQGVKTRTRARETYHPIQQWIAHYNTSAISGAAQRKSTTSNLESDVAVKLSVN
jgi:hypothetical protein